MEVGDEYDSDDEEQIEFDEMDALTEFGIPDSEKLTESIGPVKKETLHDSGNHAPEFPHHNLDGSINQSMLVRSAMLAVQENAPPNILQHLRTHLSSRVETIKSPPPPLSPLERTPIAPVKVRETHFQRAIEMIKPLLTQPTRPGLGYPEVNRNMPVWLAGYKAAVLTILRQLQQADEQEEREKS